MSLVVVVVGSGVGLQLRGLWFAHSHGGGWGGVGVEGAALPPHTTLLSQKHSINHHNLVACTNGEGGEPSRTPLAQALRAPCSGHQPEATSAAAEWSAGNTGSQETSPPAGPHPEKLTWALRRRRKPGAGAQGSGQSLYSPLNLTWPTVYHNTGMRTRSVTVVTRSMWGAKGNAVAAATAPGSSRVLSNRCSLSLLE